MPRNILLLLVLIISIVIISCEDDIFAPKTFEGTWNVIEYDNELNELHFIVGIDYLPGTKSSISIGNFSNLGLDYEVFADISGTDLTIYYQEVDGAGGIFRISGTGVAISNLKKITWEYKLDGEDYAAIFEKK